MTEKPGGGTLSLEKLSELYRLAKEISCGCDGISLCDSHQKEWEQFGAITIERMSEKSASQQ
jgi:hypothetical protein